MSNTSALLSALLTCRADINYYTQQQIFWNQKYEANFAKLEDQVKLEEKWYEAYDKCMDGKDDGSGIQFRGRTFNPNCECDAIEYADLKVDQFDAEMLEYYSDLDIEYDTRKTTLETLLEELRAKEEGLKTAVSTAAQDTGMLNAG